MDQEPYARPTEAGTIAALVAACRMAMVELGVKFTSDPECEPEDERMVCLGCHASGRHEGAIVHADLCVTLQLEAAIAMATGEEIPPRRRITDGWRVRA